MAGELSLAVRIAHHAVSAVDDSVALMLSTMQAIGRRNATGPRRPALGSFRQASRWGARAAKWSLVGVILLGAVLILGVPFMARSGFAAGGTQLRPAQEVVPVRCRSGANPTLSDIERAQCGAHLPVPLPRCKLETRNEENLVFDRLAHSRDARCR